MGFCREGFGKISIESRRESFYIHHDYEPGDGSLWADAPHPELGYEDLENLIEALTDLRENDTRYREWLESRKRETDIPDIRLQLWQKDTKADSETATTAKGITRKVLDEGKRGGSS